MNVLFLCTGNSARSILAEAILNDLPQARGRFRAFSAGSHPKSEVNPAVLQLLQENHIATDGLRPKSWDEFCRPDAPVMDFVFTVCDQAAQEPCPLWPGHPVKAHWGVVDPAKAAGTEEEQHRAFLDAFFVLRRRIELFVALPVEKLSGLALSDELATIGAHGDDRVPAAQ